MAKRSYLVKTSTNVYLEYTETKVSEKPTYLGPNYLLPLEYNCFKIKNTSVGTAMRMNETFMSPILE